MDTASLDSIYELPINSRRDEIIRSVDTNQVTIITAETGAGKSTQVPQYLAEHGYKKIIVTQPRILAARNLSQRVRQEYSWRMGRDCSAEVGYRTAHEADDDAQNVILYCTDGLQLVRELTGSGTSEKQVLILDEIHEWNENMEVLIAWAKRRCTEEPRFKLVLMSATIEADSLAEYFGAPAPITVAGRSFPVERLHGKNLVEEIMQRRGSNILVFLPGKAEIEQVAEAVQGNMGNMPVIPLHSQLEAEQQQLAFASHTGGKIVLSTNIAQTSITIDDIDVVIDSGLERRAEVRNGVEGLFITEVSQADCLQRAGRAGRTKPGTYVLARLGRMPCSKLEDRTPYGVPEIMRKHIDRLTLRLANINLDIEDLEFFHAPSHGTIKQAKRTLVALGALADGVVTPLGRQMERFPVESQYSRMLVEASKYAEAVQYKLASIIAIQEVGGIVKSGPRHIGWQRFTNQQRSDLLAQYDVALALLTIPEHQFDDLGIIAKNIEKAADTTARLQHDMGLVQAEITPLLDDEIDAVLRCIIAGQLHQIWLLNEEGAAVNVMTKQRRELSSTTVVKAAGLFAGTPFDLEVPTNNGLETLHLVNGLTAVDPEWLVELAPATFSARPGKIYYDSQLGVLARHLKMEVNGTVLQVRGIAVSERSADNQRLFSLLVAQWIEQRLDTERSTLKGSNHRRIPPIPTQKVREKINRLTRGAISLQDIGRSQRVEIFRLGRLETWLGREFMATLHPPHHERPFGGNRHKRRSEHKPKHHRDKDWRRHY